MPRPPSQSDYLLPPPPSPPSITSSRLAVLLATCRALMRSPSGDSHHVRMLVDPGSELTFISRSLVKQLQFPKQPSAIPILGIGGFHSGRTCGTVSVTLQSIHSPWSILITAHVLPKLITRLPLFGPLDRQWTHLQGLLLADPTFLIPGRIDLILGADTYGLFVQSEILKGAEYEPVAQRTIFGWIVLGPLSIPSPSETTACQATASQDIHDLLTSFWLQEEVPSTTANLFTPEEAECETHSKATHSRDPSGCYIVRLPFKSPATQLGNSHQTAQACLQRLLRRFSSDEAYRLRYSLFMREYEELRHMTRVPLCRSDSTPVYYLPHHAVLKGDDIRVVFNGSSITSTGLSLNDLLHTGAKLQSDISDVLLWIRLHRYIFITDIRKMFRQIMLHPDDWVFQRIL
ncbi:uncharacterized protein LOC112452118 [Temnothorax curvispinosus]|uniref:Uncharacterized protein LOC112452118 n=1 Tax=Temnothorax curvispinosus TaxID=300111 RepID=A0A6J1PEI1_9HYME|nr:uncharacterized protein LOC112452118 [Temnothorax curvispinosus]